MIWGAALHPECNSAADRKTVLARLPCTSFFRVEAFAEEDLVPLLLAKGVVNHELVFPVLRPLAVKMAQIHWNPNIFFRTPP